MKVAFYLKRPQLKSDTSIFIRISYKGNQLKYYIAENINPKFWNKDTHRAKETQKFREYPEFNARLDHIESTIKSVYRRYLNDHANEIPSSSVLKELLDKEFKRATQKAHSSTLLGFFEQFIEQTRSGVRIHPKSGKPYSPNTVKVYVTAHKHLINYQTYSKKRIDFDSIDLGFYMDFNEYLIKNIKLSTNAIGKNIQVIKLIMNEATERGINNNVAFKSRRFAIVSEKADNIYLTREEIEEIERIDLSANERLDRVRDLFLIGCHTGLRYSDYSTLNASHIKDGFIEIVQTKTGNPVSIPVHATVERIIAKYEGHLPRSISNQKSNDYLKELGKMIPTLHETTVKNMTKGGSRVSTTHQKWELLSTHTARRSFATNQYLLGVPAITIMAITGHRTEKAFLKYIKLTSKEHATVMKQHWNKSKQLLQAV